MITYKFLKLRYASGLTDFMFDTSGMNQIYYCYTFVLNLLSATIVEQSQSITVLHKSGMV